MSNRKIEDVIKDLEQNLESQKDIEYVKKVLAEFLEEYQTNLGYYTFRNTKIGLYDINEKKTLVYISPREILSNETRTYNSKTYEYTHGYGVIATSASNTDSTGNLDYIKKPF